MKRQIRSRGAKNECGEAASHHHLCLLKGLLLAIPPAVVFAFSHSTQGEEEGAKATGEDIDEVVVVQHGSVASSVEHEHRVYVIS